MGWMFGADSLIFSRFGLEEEAAAAATAAATAAAAAETGVGRLRIVKGKSDIRYANIKE